MNSPRQLITTIGLLVLSMVASPGAKAENASDAKATLNALTNPSANQPAKNTAPNMNRMHDSYFKHLTQAPSELPNLGMPSTKDSKFVMGLQRTNPKSGAINLWLKFKVNESKQQIMQQFADGMGNGKWQMGKSDDPDQINATWHGNSASIKATSGHGPGSILQVTYSMKPQQN